MAKLTSLTVRGYKSIRQLEDFKLGNLNVLIGANGAGKSNFISLFRMLAELTGRQLKVYVEQQGGPDALLFGTRKRTQQIDAEFYFARNGYRISLKPAGNKLIFGREETWFKGDLGNIPRVLGSGHDETLLLDAQDSFAHYVRPAIASWRVYHFHDTSPLALARQSQPIRDNLRLKPDAGNIAPFLRRLREQHSESYQRIVESIQMIAPFFGDFVYRKETSDRVDLEWFEAGDPDTPRSPLQLSDGMLRFICLATLLLQPSHLQPDTILIDEPELGLHPYAIAVLGGLMRQAGDNRQLIVATQSAELVNEVNPEDVIVVGRADGASTFEHLEPDRLAEWLNDYALGELWRMNIIGGRPKK